MSASPESPHQRQTDGPFTKSEVASVGSASAGSEASTVDPRAVRDRWVVIACGIGAGAALLWFLALQPPVSDPFAPAPRPTEAAWWWQPHETNPILRAPGAPALALRAVAFSDAGDGVVGWAVGDAGLILRSTDRGLTWIQQRGTLALPMTVDQRVTPAPAPRQFGPEQSKAAASLVEPRRFGASGGDSPLAMLMLGQIAVPADGREEDPAERLQSRPSLRAVEATPRGAWAVGDGGAVVYSEDAGGSWSAVELPGRDQPLRAVARVDDQVWVSSLTEIFVRMADGSWVVGTSGLDARPPWLRIETWGARGWLLADGDLFETDTSLPGWRNSGGYGVKGGSTGTLLDWTPVGGGEVIGIDAGGRILVSADTRATWTAAAMPPGMRVTRLRFIENRIGWAVGERGAILTTVDGQNWVAQSSGTSADLAGVRFLSTTEGVVVGGGLTILHTRDGGRTWLAADFRYRRMPAPLLWIVLGLAAAVVFLTWRRGRPAVVAPVRSVADLLVSDRPLRKGDRDRLGFAPLAAALAGYLRNSKTGVPLTMAISGKWGSGKSSLMAMLRDELEEGGFPVVWFNAWHHEREDQLLAAVVENIRSQSRLPLWTPGGAWFRARLVWRRVENQWLRALLLAFLLAAGVALVHGAGDASILQAFSSPEGLAPLAALFGRGAGFLAIVIATWRFLGALRSFGVRPGELLAVTSSNASAKDLEAQTSFRYRFAREFQDVTQALAPRRLVIFVDDLDRCRPAHVLQMLELVNYLATAGDCFIVLALDRDIVTDCLARSLEDRFTIQKGRPVTPEEAQHERLANAKRWLEKLVQLVVNVPGFEETHLSEIMEAAEQENGAGLRDPQARQPARPRSIWAEAWVGAKHSVSVRVAAFAVGLVLLVVFGFETGGVILERVRSALPGREAPAVQAGARDVPLQRVKGTIFGVGVDLEVSEVVPPAAEADAATGAGPAGATAPETGVDLEAGRDPTPRPPEGEIDGRFRAGRGTWGWWVAVAFALYLLVGYRMHRRGGVVEDSPAFQQALRRWLPHIAARIETPRAAKIFINRVRFYAMLGRVFQGGDARAAAPSESLYVAFGAMEELRAENGRAAPAGFPAAPRAATDAIVRDVRELEAAVAVDDGIFQRLSSLVEFVGSKSATSVEVEPTAERGPPPAGPA